MAVRISCQIALAASMPRCPPLKLLMPHGWPLAMSSGVITRSHPVGPEAAGAGDERMGRRQWPTR